MNKQIPAILLACTLTACTGASGGALWSSQTQSPCKEDVVMNGSTWCAIAFGQSTDLNYSSTILPEKVGVNNVWREGSATPMRVTDAAGIHEAVTIESRGGKIANTHDGLTFYYTQLPADKNFRLEAEVTVEQFGPEVLVKGVKAATNGQESAGLMVRDTIGSPRREPLEEGYEEFPSASNMVANAIMQNGKNNEGRIMLRSIYRDGVSRAWGNAGAIIPKSDFIDGSAGLRTPASFRMSLQRTDEGFVIGYAAADGSNARTQKVTGANANIVQSIDARNMYVGVYASRNVRIHVRNIRLELSDAHTVAAPRFVPETEKLRFEVASPARSATADYRLQARASTDGLLSIRQDGQPLVTRQAVKAGETFAQTTRLKGQANQFELSFASDTGAETKTENLTVTRVNVADPTKLYAAPDGSPTADGSAGRPLDLASALQSLAPGGTLHLLPGSYGETTMSIDLSGSPDARKTLVADGAAVFTGKFAMDANYWHFIGIEVAGAQFRVSGSHNVFERMNTHGNIDTGFQITALAKERALWPAGNLVLNSISHDNHDPSAFNADGFAAKLGVGKGNVFRNCLSYNNADDGWDLFNKIEDGPNEPVTIENSYAYGNGNNGFKLGGEGQPVAHVIRNSVAFHNNLDGFTDNFNPGALTVTNNISFDNVRFNYIFRPSPYGGPETQGHFSGNLSLRTDYSGKYDDAVVGMIGDGNAFIAKGASSASADDFISVKAPVHIKRKADGSPDPEGFLQRR